MSKLILLITLVLEAMLALTRYLACVMKRRDKYGGDAWISRKRELLGQNADKGVKPPKVTDPHSRDV